MHVFVSTLSLGSAYPQIGIVHLRKLEDLIMFLPNDSFTTVDMFIVPHREVVNGYSKVRGQH